MYSSLPTRPGRRPGLDEQQPRCPLCRATLRVAAYRGRWLCAFDDVYANPLLLSACPDRKAPEEALLCTRTCRGRYAGGQTTGNSGWSMAAPAGRLSCRPSKGGEVRHGRGACRVSAARYRSDRTRRRER